MGVLSFYAMKDGSLCVHGHMHTFCKDGRITWPHFVPPTSRKNHCPFATNQFQVWCLWSVSQQIVRSAEISSALHLLPSDGSPLIKRIHRPGIITCIRYGTIADINNHENLSIHVYVHPYSVRCLFWTIDNSEVQIHVHGYMYRQSPTFSDEVFSDDLQASKN